MLKQTWKADITNTEEYLELLQWVGKSWEGWQLEMFWKKKTFFRVKVNFYCANHDLT